jgi:hypothetical protein
MSASSWFLCLDLNEVAVEVNLRPTVSLPIYLGVGLQDQIFYSCVTFAGFLMKGVLFDKSMGV